VAFSRVLLDLATSLGEVDAFWPILLPLPLMLLCIRHETPPSGDRGRGGGVLLTAGVGLNLLGILVDAWSIARYGLPLAVIGVARLTGRPALGVALMSLWLVPLPTSILALATPGPETAFATLGAAVVAALGAPLEAVGPGIRGPAGSLLFNAMHSGIVLAAGLSLLGWYAGLRQGRSLAGALGRAVAGALLAFPIHGVGVCIAAGILWAGFPGIGQAFVDWGVLAGVSLVAVARVELGARDADDPPV
jgi:hypothetical protein